MRLTLLMDSIPSAYHVQFRCNQSQSHTVHQRQACMQQCGGSGSPNLVSREVHFLEHERVRQCLGRRLIHATKAAL